MYRIREFFRSIKNLINWFPIIWKDRQWDSTYIEDVILKKLVLMKSYHEKRQTFVGWRNEVKWITICISLLERLKNNVYWQDEYDGKEPSINGLSPRSKEYLILYRERNKGYYGDFWEEKTRRLFWKIFIWRYKYWWD